MVRIAEGFLAAATFGFFVVAVCKLVMDWTQEPGTRRSDFILGAAAIVILGAAWLDVLPILLLIKDRNRSYDLDEPPTGPTRRVSLFFSAFPGGRRLRRQKSIDPRYLRAVNKGDVSN